MAYKAYAYSGLIRRARGEVEWARDGLRLLERLHPGLTASQDDPDPAAQGSGEVGHH